MGEFALPGPELVYETMQKVQLLRERLKTSFSRHKSNVDNRKRGLEYIVGDWVYLKISPMKGIMMFRKKGKLSTRYVVRYEILKRVGSVAYELNFPNELVMIYPVFHVFMLKKCIGDLVSIFLQ